MPVRLEFTLTLRDYFEGQLLHARRSWWPRLNMFMYRFGFPAWGALLMIAGFVLAATAAPPLPVVIVFAGGLILLSYPIYLRYRLKYIFRQTRSGDGRMTFEFDESGIRSSTEGTRGEVEWSAIQTVREDQTLILIYLAPAKMFMIPKRVCSSQEVENLHQLFHARISAR